MNKLYTIFGHKFVYRGITSEGDYLYKDIDNGRLVFIQYNHQSEIPSTSPYNWLLYNAKEGDKVWTDTYGEVEFICCEHNFIKCLVDNEIEVVYSANGHPCWWSDEYHCYRFDDETPCGIWPSKGKRIWEANIIQVI